MKLFVVLYLILSLSLIDFIKTAERLNLNLHSYRKRRKMQVSAKTEAFLRNKMSKIHTMMKGLIDSDKNSEFLDGTEAIVKMENNVDKLQKISDEFKDMVDKGKKVVEGAKDVYEGILSVIKEMKAKISTLKENENQNDVNQKYSKNLSKLETVDPLLQRKNPIPQRDPLFVEKSSKKVHKFNRKRNKIDINIDDLNAVDKTAVVGECFKGIMAAIPPNFCFREFASSPDCPSGWHKYFSHCVKNCKNNYTLTLGWCWENCGVGWTDLGLFCWGGRFKFKRRDSYFDEWKTYYNDEVRCKKNYTKTLGFCYRDCSVLGLQSCGPFACAATNGSCAAGIIEKIIDVGVGIFQFATFIVTVGLSSADQILIRSAKTKLTQAIEAFVEPLSAFAGRVKAYFQRLKKADWNTMVKVDALKFGGNISCGFIADVFYDKIINDDPQRVTKNVLVTALEKMLKFKPSMDACNNTAVGGFTGCIKNVMGDISFIDPTGIATIVYGILPTWCDYSKIDLVSLSRRRRNVDTNLDEPFEGKVKVSSVEAHAPMPHKWVNIINYEGNKFMGFTEYNGLIRMHTKSTTAYGYNNWIFEDQGNENYIIRSPNKLALHINSQNKLIAKESNQPFVFTIKSAGTGLVNLIPTGSNNCLEMSNDDSFLFTAVCNEDNTKGNQIFKLVDVREQDQTLLPTSFFNIKSTKIQKCIWARESNQEVIQSECSFYDEKDNWYLAGVPNRDGLFYIVSGTGLYLSDKVARPAHNIKGSQLSANDEKFMWYLNALHENKWHIRNLGINKCIDVQYGYSESGRNMITWNCEKNNDNQYFNLELSNLILYNHQLRMLNRNTKRCLSDNNNLEVSQIDCESLKTQIWTFTANLEKKFKFTSLNGKVLEYDNTMIKTGNSSNDSRQLWSLEYVQHRYYILKNQRYTNKCISGKNGDINKLESIDCNKEDTNQHFMFFFIRLERQRIISVESDKCLQHQINQPVVLTNCQPNQQNQSFKFIGITGSDFQYFVIGNDGEALDLNGGVFIRPKNDQTSAQKFDIIPIDDHHFMIGNSYYCLTTLSNEENANLTLTRCNEAINQKFYLTMF